MRFYELNSGKITIGCQDISKMKWSDLRSMFGMDRLMQGRTAFVIAHCLSTIRDADSIIVLKDGDIVEVGNHDSFMAKKGFCYFTLLVAIKVGIFNSCRRPSPLVSS